MTEIAYNLSSKARELLAHWHERWGLSERLSDVAFDRELLLPWVDDVALFEPLDRGADFRPVEIGRNLTTLFGDDCSRANLSEFPVAYRQRLRQVLLRATMTRAPATESLDWLADGSVCSAIVCALPVAGGFYQPSRLLLALFHRTVDPAQRHIWGSVEITPTSSRHEGSVASVHSLPPSVSNFLRIETLYLGGGSVSGSAALSPRARQRHPIE